MVKVFPNTSFSIFKGQTFIKTSSEPVATDSSDNLTIIATKNCTIEVHSTEEDSIKRVSEFSTLSPVYDLVYNAVGNCIVTCETRDPRSIAQARVYFNWFGATKATSISPRCAHTATAKAQHLAQNIQKSKNVEVVELTLQQCSPTTERFLSIACCKTTGIFGVGHGKDIRLFVLQEIPVPGEDGVVFDVSVFADVSLGFSIRCLSISHNFIGATSPSEMHLLKWHVSGGLGLIVKETSDNLSSTGVHVGDNHIVMDSNFVLWSSSTKAGLSSTSCSRPTSHPGSRTGSRVGSKAGSRASSPTQELTSSNVQIPDSGAQFLTVPTISNQPQSGIGIISLKKVAKMARLCTVNDLDQVTEVFGPIDFIRGVPASFAYRSHKRGRVESSISTLIYKFTPPTPTQGRRNSSASNSSSAQQFSSVQLMPLVIKEDNQSFLVGMGCIVTTEHRGYFYDIFGKAAEVHNFSFIHPGQMSVYDGDFLHIVNEKGLESYTTRLLPTCLAGINKPLQFGPSSSGKETQGKVSKELLMCKFCPPSTIQETMMGHKYLIGACMVSGSATHVAVVTKDSSSALPKSSAEGKLSSTGKSSHRRNSIPSEVAWNVYILQKQSMQVIAQEFVTTAHQFEDCSPPTFHGLLSEAHLLLRAKMLSGQQGNSECQEMFVTTCCELAHYFAFKTSKKDRDALIASSYLHLALVPPERATHLLGTLNPKALLMYFEAILYSPDWPHQTLSQSTLECMWELYAEHLPGSLPRVLMLSWVKRYDYDRAMELLYSCTAKMNPNSVLSPREKVVTSAFLLCQLGQEEEALARLQELQELFLHQWCHTYSRVLLTCEQPPQLTAFGKIFLKSAESSIIEFLIEKVFVQHTMDFSTAFGILKGYSEDHNKVQKFLEAVLSLANLHSDDQDMANKLLLEIYLFRILEMTVDKKTVVMESSLPCPHQESCPVDAWLQKCMLHLNQGPPLKKAPQTVLVQYCHTIQHLILPDASLDDCLQSNLQELVTKLSKEEDNLNTLPVVLTVFHLLGKIEEGVCLAAAQVPVAMGDYIKCVCLKDPIKWRCALPRVCDIIRSSGAGLNATLTQTYISLLSDSLVVLEPQEVLTSLLPVDGNTAYLLPAIRKLSCTLISHQVHKQCQAIIQSTNVHQ